MLTESEVLSKFRQSLAEAKDACAWLAKNSDPDWLAPRGRHYRLLKTACSELEGCARQMNVFRGGDTRWLPLGILYGAKVPRLAQKYFVKMKWSGFKELIKIFEQGELRANELAQAKTGRAGPILPKRTDWLVLPDPVVPKQNPLLGTLH